MMDDYERIIEIYKKPANFGRLEKATHSGEAANASCGDDIKLEMLVSGDRIMHAFFSGTACAVAVASCSLLTEKLKGMTVVDARKLGENDIIELIGRGIAKNASRKRCALLSLNALKKALGAKNE